MAVEIRSRRIGSGDQAVEIIDVIGRLDAPGSALLRSTVQEKLKEGMPRVAVNFSECIEINKENINTLHSLGRACQRAGGKLVLYGAAGDVDAYIRKYADKTLAPWFEWEREAIIDLGGEVAPEPGDGEEEPPVVVALGADPIFRKIFWQLSRLGGRAIAKFDNISSTEDFLKRRQIHSIIIDTGLSSHEIAKLIRRLRTTPKLKNAGIFLVGPPSQRNIGRSLILEGADNFIPFIFTGEEIAAKFDARTFFQRLKDAYDRFELKRAAQSDGVV